MEKVSRAKECANLFRELARDEHERCLLIDEFENIFNPDTYPVIEHIKSRFDDKFNQFKELFRK